MGRKSLCLLIVGILVAYYIYTPLPDKLEEPWRLMLISVPLKTFLHLATFIEFLGLYHFADLIALTVNFEEVSPNSDENVTVTETKFDNVPVRVYVPKRKLDARRSAVFFIHGGGWCSGSPALRNYDLLSRWTAERLDAVIISIDYRLAPKYHFPVQFEDVYNALRWFLHKNILENYGINPERICVSGDSAGGNLAAAVTQQLFSDPDVNIKPKIQALIYPALQPLDLDSPSYQENLHMPILPKSLMTRFWSEYFTRDRSLEKAMLSNQHVPAESSHLFQFVNWSSLLPERFRKGYVYNNPTYGSSELSQKYPGFLDVRAAPLLADDSKLHGLPLTYVLTCQYDILRDDGLMYVTRLRNAGVQVTHNHVEDGFHGAMSFPQLKITHRVINQYISWLKENL
ncbi:Arylacetamide deacetylase [Heterocephalus glaber]|uniref:Arylacetamide deacetylase n=1 Tax=Heterocephalus glaber TaxID=10181 RepID=G5C109_HETGA|nr:arylacetamide deacetylase [Heterocephalus glaber]EHB15220.1 Arylacetamide deacetylase [Heterocephalus glaber]